VPQSALSAFLVVYRLAGSKDDAILEIDCENLHPHDDDGEPCEPTVDDAMREAIITLNDRYSKDIVDDGEIVRVYGITLTKHLLYGDPSDQDVADEKSEADLIAAEKVLAEKADKDPKSKDGKRQPAKA